MLLTLQQLRRKAHALKSITKFRCWDSIAVSGRCIASSALIVESNPRSANAPRIRHPLGEVQGEAKKLDAEGLNVRDKLSKTYNITPRDKDQNIMGHNSFLTSIERFIASQPFNSQLDSFIHHRLSSPQYLRQYPNTASRAALLEQLVQLLISKRCYVQAAGVYNRMRDWEGYVPASGKSGGEQWKTEAMMLGMALAVSEKTPSTPATEIDQTISTLAILFRHTSSDRLLLDLVILLTKLGVGNALMEKVVRVYISCREEMSSSKSDGYIPPLSIVSLFAGLLTRQGKVHEALEFVERCDDLRCAESQYNRVVARSHPYNTILASISFFSAHERTEVVDLVLSVMASRGVPSDKSLINILIRDQADRANAPRSSSDTASSHLSNGRNPAQTSHHHPSIIDDASEIGQIWDSISGNSRQIQGDYREQRKRKNKEQSEAFEKVFALYGTLCQAHIAQENQAVSTISTRAASEETEVESQTPSFKPDFFTYRTLWDLLVRRPRWRFPSFPSPTGTSIYASNPSSVSEAHKTTVQTRDVNEDEYGFDLTMGSDEFDEDEPELSNEASDFDENFQSSISPVLPPRKIFHDMVQYHLSQLINQPISTNPRCPQNPRPQNTANDDLDVKTTAQSQLLLNTALLTFLNRSPSCGGADYAGAMVVLRCFGLCLERLDANPTSSTLSGSMPMETWKEAEKDKEDEISKLPFSQAAEARLSATKIRSPQIPQIPIPLRTYRILCTHLLQFVTSDLRLALKEGAGRGSAWARWILGTGAGDLRKFRQLLSSASSTKKQDPINYDKIHEKWIVKRRRPTEKIVERILKVSSTPVPNEDVLLCSRLSSSLVPNSVANSLLAFHRDFYYFQKYHPLISHSTASTHSIPPMLYVPTYAQIFRSAPLPSLMYYYPENPSYNHSTRGAKGVKGTQNQLKTRSLNPIPLEMMVKRAWIASNYGNYTRYPDLFDYIEGDEMQGQEGGGSEKDEELRRLKQLLNEFEKEVERAWREMIPS